MWFAAILAVVTIIIAFVITSNKKKESVDEVRAWKNSFLSVLLSSLLALSIGIFLYFMQKNVEDNSQREAYRLMISNEIGYIMLSIEERGALNLTLGTDSLSTKLLYLPCSVLEEAAKSGLFTRERSWNMISVAAMIREHNLLTEYLITSMSTAFLSSANKQLVKNAVTRLNKASERAHQGGGAILKQLGLGVTNLAFETFGITLDSTNISNTDK